MAKIERSQHYIKNTKYFSSFLQYTKTFGYQHHKIVKYFLFYTNIVKFFFLLELNYSYRWQLFPHKHIRQISAMLKKKSCYLCCQLKKKYFDQKVILIKKFFTGNLLKPLLFDTHYAIFFSIVLFLLLTTGHSLIYLIKIQWLTKGTTLMSIYKQSFEILNN